MQSIETGETQKSKAESTNLKKSRVCITRKLLPFNEIMATDIEEGSLPEEREGMGREARGKTLSVQAALF